VAAASLALGLAGSGVASLAAAQGTAPAGQEQSQKPEASRAPLDDLRPVDILEFDIDGNTVLDEEAIDEAVYPFLGPQRTRHDIDSARAALEKAYVDRGYKTVAVIIPSQMVVHGVIHLQVVEGRVGHLAVVGSKYHSIVHLKKEVPSMAEGSVPNFNEVQRDLAHASQQTDRSVTPRLKAGAAPGTIDVDLLVDDHLPLHGSVEVNNQYSQNTTPLRTIGTLSYNNLLQMGHSVTVTYETAPMNPSDARVVFASYLAPLGKGPFSLLIDGFHSGSNVAAVGGTDVVGKGQIGEIKGIFTLGSSSTAYQAVTLGVAYKHFDDRTDIAATGQQGPQGFSTPVTYFPLSVGYSVVLRGASSATQLDLTASFAVPELGSLAYPSDAELNHARFKATGQELYLRENLAVTHDLGRGFSAYLRLSGQLTDQPLITNEQLTAGGAASVRGYVEAEALGDNGLSGTLELRSPQLSPGGFRHWLRDLRVFAFLDGAKLFVLDPIVDKQTQYTQPDRYSLQSFGAGGTMQMLGFLNGSLTYARTAHAGPVTPAGKNGVLFRVWGAF
jgi:hemolysin activation/secretion protein